MQREQANGASVLMQIPDNIANEEYKAPTQKDQMKSKEHSTSKLRSLASVKNEIRVIESEANPIGSTPYLQPYCLTDPRTEGSQVYTTDTYHEPDCLRFCPSNSSQNLEISLSGINLSFFILSLFRIHSHCQGLVANCTHK